mgnify:CR=1 FL=1
MDKDILKAMENNMEEIMLKEFDQVKSLDDVKKILARILACHTNWIHGLLNLNNGLLSVIQDNRKLIKCILRKE